MVYALIFAGGVGSRIGYDVPKQFIEINNKPIIVYTLDVFNCSNAIDGIVVVTLSEYIDKVKNYVKTYELNKVIGVVPGGSTAMESQFNGLTYLKEFSKKDDIVFIHDGVRPFIDNNLSEKCLKTTGRKKNAITISSATETVSILNENNQIEKILPRQKCVIARAPQVFYLDDVYNAHIKVGDKRNCFVDSASLMLEQGMNLNVVEGPSENIKITTMYDLLLCELWINKHEKN